MGAGRVSLKEGGYLRKANELNPWSASTCVPVFLFLRWVHLGLLKHDNDDNG